MIGQHRHVRREGSGAGMVSGAGAASAAQQAAQASLPAEPQRVVRGREHDYCVISELDREMARRIADETSLSIPFPRGVSRMGIVTHWAEDPKGKLSLGQGALGVFCLGQVVDSGKFVGLKLSPACDEASREASLQGALRGIPGVLSAVESIESRGKAYQVLELAGLGSLAKLKPLILGLTNRAVQEQLLYHIAVGLLRPLQQLHKRDLYHLDLKPDNAVVNQKGVPFLIDFDCAQHSPTGEINVLHARGDTRYDAPERVLGCWSGMRELAICSGEKLDSWAVGLLLCELTNGVTLDPRELYDALDANVERLPQEVRTLLAAEEVTPTQCLQRLLDFRLNLPSSEFGLILRGLLAFDPSERLSPGAALDLPWFSRMGEETAGTQMQSQLRLREMVELGLLNRVGGTLSPQEVPKVGIDYVERPELQRALLGRLDSSERLTVLLGEPGVGKSALAMYMLQDPGVRERFGALLWFRNCRSEQELEGQFVDLAAEMGLGGESTQFEEAFSLLNHHLRSHSKPPLWVFDDASEPSLLTCYVDLPGHQIVTTTRSGWDGELHVGVMSAEEGRAFIISQLRCTASKADELCRVLRHIPLALSQGCAYISNHQIAIETYCEQLEEGAALDQTEDQAGYRPHTYSIRQMYQAQFKGLGANLSDYVRLALLGPGVVPGRTAKALCSPDALERLVQASLLQTPTPYAYSLDRSPQQEVLRQTPATELCEPLRSAMRGLFQVHEKFNSIASPGEKRGLLHQAHQLLAFRDHFSPLPEALREPVVMMMQVVMSLSNLYGRPSDIESLLVEAVEIGGQVYAADPDRLQYLLTVVVDGYIALKRYDEAIAPAERALAIQEQIFQPNDLRLEATLRQLGMAMNRCRRDAEAVRYLRRAHEIVQQRGGDQDLELVASSIELVEAEFDEAKRTGAGGAGTAANRSAAILRCRAGMNRLLAVAGLERDAAVALVRLGNLLLEDGQHEAAFQDYERASELFKLSYGTQNRHLSVCLENMGAALFKAGRIDEAIHKIQEALELNRELFGENGLPVVKNLDDLGTALSSREEHDQALLSYQRAYAIRLQIFEPGHEELALSLVKIGHVWMDKKQFSESLKCFGEAVTIFQAASSARMAAEAHNNMGCVYYELNQHHKAIECYRRAIAQLESVEGVEAEEDRRMYTGNIRDSEAALSGEKPRPGDK